MWLQDITGTSALCLCRTIHSSFSLPSPPSARHFQGHSRISAPEKANKTMLAKITRKNQITIPKKIIV
jgi:hypothetical protein